MFSTNLDVFPEQVGIETQPVSGDVKSSLEQDIPQKSTGIYYNKHTTRHFHTAHRWWWRWWWWCKCDPLPFMRISSFGTAEKSLWYCELYLLTVCEENMLLTSNRTNGFTASSFIFHVTRAANSDWTWLMLLVPPDRLRPSSATSLTLMTQSVTKSSHFKIKCHYI